MVELDNNLIKQLRQSANKHGLEDVVSGCGMSKSAFYKYVGKKQKTVFENKYNIIAVYTQPPKKKFRGQKFKESPIHALSKKLNYPVRYPKNLLNNDEYKKLGANALEFSKNFSWEKIVKKYIELI